MPGPRPAPRIKPRPLPRLLSPVVQGELYGAAAGAGVGLLTGGLLDWSSPTTAGLALIASPILAGGGGLVGRQVQQLFDTRPGKED